MFFMGTPCIESKTPLYTAAFGFLKPVSLKTTTENDIFGEFGIGFLVKQTPHR